MELELREPSERELETGEREPEPEERKPEPGEREPEPGEREPEQGEPSTRADSIGDERRLDERAVLLIINKRSTLVRKREVSPHKNIAAAPTEYLKCISIFSTRMCDKGWGWSRIRSIVILFSTDERVLIRFEDVSGVRAGHHRRIRFGLHSVKIRPVSVTPTFFLAGKQSLDAPRAQRDQCAPPRRA